MRAFFLSLAYAFESVKVSGLNTIYFAVACDKSEGDSKWRVMTRITAVQGIFLLSHFYSMHQYRS